MKEKVIAVIIFLLVLVASGVNTYLTRQKIDLTIDEVKMIDTSESKGYNEAEGLFQNYLGRQRFISLTVSHEDLTRIEESFCEVISCIKVGDSEGAEIAKDRLIHSLEHLRRLSGFNIDSII